MSSSNKDIRLEAGPYFIGLAGGSCSGKSELAGALRSTIGAERCAILSLDSYYVIRNARSTYGQVNLDSPEVFDLSLCSKHLEALRRSEPVEIPLYDRSIGVRSGSRAILSADVVIVEGLFAISDKEIRRQLNLKVYLDVPADIRLTRRFLRDVKEYGFDVRLVSDYYIQIGRKMHDQFVSPSQEHADLILKWPALLDDDVSEILKACDGSRVRADHYQ